MASVRPGLARSASLLVASTTVGRGQKDLLSNVPPESNWAMDMPDTSEEISSREHQRVKDYEERKASRSARLKSITNQWADNRIKNSTLRNPRRSSWKRSEKEEVDSRRCDYLFCCFG